MKNDSSLKVKLPNYTRGEEIFNMVTHIVGGAFGVMALILCIVFSIIKKNWWGLGSGIVYGLSMIFLYTMSSIYHGLIPGKAKKVFRVLDHCSIYALILGTYVPILFTGIREYSFPLFLTVSIIVSVGAIIGVTFTAIDLHKYKVLSMSSYFIIGWCAIFLVVPIVKAFNWEFMFWIFIGGAAYTLGMIFFAKGMKKKYYHSIFHIFILAGSVLQFIGIFKFCILR